MTLVEAEEFIAQVEAVLNATDPRQEPLLMWLRRTVERYREADRLWRRRVDESRNKNARIEALEAALRGLISALERDHDKNMPTWPNSPRWKDYDKWRAGVEAALALCRLTLGTENTAFGETSVKENETNG